MGAIGTRVKARYRGMNVYVSIFPEKREVFVSMVEHTKKHDDNTLAGIDSIARLSSKLWQSTCIEEVLKQLKRSSRVTHDFPGILHGLLVEHVV